MWSGVESFYQSQGVEADCSSALQLAQAQNELQPPLPPLQRAPFSTIFSLLPESRASGHSLNVQ